MGVEDLELGLSIGVAEGGAQQEAVELAVGHPVRALVLDRVLRGDHEEGTFEWVGHAVRRDLPLLHRLEQRGLCARRGTVDLVGQEDVAEHRTGLELERVPPAVPHGHSGHVRGEEIGGALDPSPGAVDRRRDGLRQAGLADAGHVSIRRCPSASRPVRASSIDSGLPWTARLMLPAITSNRSGKVGAARSTTVTDVKGRAPRGLARSAFRPGGPRRAAAYRRTVPCCLAVDIGGTKLAAELVDLDRQVLLRQTRDRRR